LLGPDNVHVLALLDWGSPAEAPKGLRVVATLGNRVGWASKIRYALKAWELGQRRYDLLIASHASVAPVAAMIKFLFGTPFWVACHSVEVWRGVPRLELAALRRAALLLPISQFTAESLWKVSGIDPWKTCILHNAVPSEFAALLMSPDGPAAPAPTRSENQPVLLSVCTLVKGNQFKGVDTVIRALPQILAAAPGLQYVVVGGGDYRLDLERLAAETGVAGHVTFVGAVTDAQLAALYRSCEVFILPSRPQQQGGYWGGEGFGRVYVEAALAGKPVVGSRTGGAAEAVLDGKTGFLVDPLSIDEVAHAVIRLVGDAELTASMGAAGRKWALENFTQRALSRAVEELLRLTGHSFPVSPCLSGEGESQRHRGTEEAESRS
jgi:phosphatidylinositol alpha-1,6-mannosyltransferase